MSGAVRVSALAEHGLSRLPRNRRGEAGFCMLRLNIGSENDERAGESGTCETRSDTPSRRWRARCDSGGIRPLKSRHSRTKDPTPANTPTLARLGTAGKTVKDLCRKGARERRGNAERVWADAAGMERSQPVSARRRALRNQR